MGRELALCAAEYTAYLLEIRVLYLFAMHRPSPEVGGQRWWNSSQIRAITAGKGFDLETFGELGAADFELKATFVTLA